MKKVSCLAVTLVMAFPVVATAAENGNNGFYFGAGVGAGRVEADLVDLGVQPMDTGEAIEGDELKATGITSKFFGGYRFLDYFAIEGGYTKIYEPDESFCFLDDTGGCAEDRGGPLSIASSAEWKVDVPVDGWTIYAMGIWPINDTFEVFGKIGAFFWEMEAEGRERVVGGFIPPKPPFIPELNSPVAQDLDGEDLALGAGVNFNTDFGVTIRSEFEYFDVSDANTVWVFSMSAFYRF